MHPNPHGEAYAKVLDQLATEILDRRYQRQARMDGPPGVVFMRLRPAKIAQQPIPQILRHMTAVTLDHLCTGGVIPPHDLAKVFGVESPSEGGRVHHITKHDGELAALGPAGGGAALRGSRRSGALETAKDSEWPVRRRSQPGQGVVPARAR